MPDKHVYGLVLGLPMESMNHGPFGLFQNCRGDAAAIGNLIRQLANRVPHCNPASHVVDSEIQTFLRAVMEVEPSAIDPAVPRLLHHVSLPVRNLGISAAFYGDDVGLAINHERNKLRFGRAGAWFNISSEQQLHLIENPSGTYRESDNIDYNDCHFAVRVPDLSAAYIRLSEKRPTAMNTEIAFTRYPHFYVLDPDNHIVEVNADTMSDQAVFKKLLDRR
jgi:catechol 2,3-dioxygenase-like lactoylglutathione lyase family enzyme